MYSDPPPACFALFDDCNATAAAPRSRLYTGYLRTLHCDSAAALPAVLDAVQRQNAHAVLLLPYELGAELHGIAPRADAMPGASSTHVLLFESCQQLSAEAVGAWLHQHADSGPAGVAQVRRSIDAGAFAESIDAIREWIAAGDTYQVNFTFRLRCTAYGDLLALYQRLRTRQPVPYGALIRLPDGCATLSLSPELFVAHQAGTVLARPMKGTARASGEAQRDAALGAALAADPKNRAENVMIVDLLRNDLGRIAATGSVEVPELFTVTRFAEVLQMTSTVRARLRSDVTLAQVVTALYPCGSITGAPKRRTMQIIRALEAESRGLYTGAIGWYTPAPVPEQIGDFCLSVPIRTLQLQAPDRAGLRQGEMGVGAGIVHDSAAADEWAECALKAEFLTGLRPQFALFETMAVTRDGCGPLRERHLARLAASAMYFNFVFDRAAIAAALTHACAALPDAGVWRLRLTLEADGSCHFTQAPRADLTTPVRLLLAPQPTRSDDLFLRHKTTLRAPYDHAWQEAERQGAFDMLFQNERGEITEGGRCTLFALIDGRWFTPPLTAGVLPGVMRAQLLADATWAASERTLTLSELKSAQQLMVCNALRGTLPALLLASDRDRGPEPIPVVRLEGAVAPEG